MEPDYKAKWYMYRYRVKGKQLASLSGDPEGRPIFAVKLEPAFSVFLREQYPATVPGYQHFFYALPQYLVEDLLRDMAAPKLPPGVLEDYRKCSRHRP